MEKKWKPLKNPVSHDRNTLLVHRGNNVTAMSLKQEARLANRDSISYIKLSV